MAKNNYNIGAGSFRHEDWINVDNDSDWYSQVQGKAIEIEWDLLTLAPIPVESNTAGLVYSSHVIEHVTDAAVQNMVNESYRILKPGGIIRIQAPDVNIFYNSYKNNKRVRWADQKTPTMSVVPLREASIPQSFVWLFAANAAEIHTDGAEVRLTDTMIRDAFATLPYEEALNYCTSKISLEQQGKYPGNHMNWWNSDKALRMLNKAGFTSYVSAFGESKAPELRDTTVFDKGNKQISFYVEAIK